jgi:hypothetical protein
MNEVLQIFIDYGTLIAYIAFSTDLTIQIIRVYRRKSSADISWKGTAMRLAGSAVILLKFVGLSDPYLIIGQILFTLAVGSYLFVILRYRKR